MTIYDGLRVKSFPEASSGLENLRKFLEHFQYSVDYGRPPFGYAPGEHRWEYVVVVKTNDVQTSDGRNLRGYYTFQFDSVSGAFNCGGRIQKEYKKDIEIIKQYVFLCCLSFGGI